MYFDKHNCYLVLLVIILEKGSILYFTPSLILGLHNYTHILPPKSSKLITPTKKPLFLPLKCHQKKRK